jgi:hypothetical protein
VPSAKELLLDDEALVHSRTPTTMKRSSSVTLDMFGRKFSNHRRSLESAEGQ